jgi:hypothetical protein
MRGNRDLFVTLYEVVEILGYSFPESHFLHFFRSEKSGSDSEDPEKNPCDAKKLAILSRRA